MTLEEVPWVMLKCLLFTCLVEVILSIILKIKDKKDLLNIVLVNVVTNPLVTSIPIYFNLTSGVMMRNISLYFLEALTVFFEGFIYKKVLKNQTINPYLLSLILNILSYLIGLIIIK